MSNTITIKRGVGKPDSLVDGELAIDTDTGDLYSLVGGVVTQLNEPPEGVDLSNVVKTDQQNDVAEGKFRLMWDHSADPDFPFNGSIGYSGTNMDPDSPGGSFLYAKGEKGTVSIGRDGDMELHGQSEIRGVADREGNLPWLTDFSYVQAADFLDADGNSIIGAGDVDLSSVLTKDQRNDVEATFQIIRDDSGAENTSDLLYVKGPSGTFSLGHNGSIALQGGTEIKGLSDPEYGYKPYLSNFSSVQADEGIFDNVQATDFLDADGNSIIGSGGGGGESLWEQNGDDIYYDKGNVGIGVDNPSGINLYVKRESSGWAGSVARTNMVLENSTSTALQFLSENTGSNIIRFGDSDATGSGYIQYRHSNDAMEFATQGTERMRIDADGNVGIGTEAPDAPLDVRTGNLHSDIFRIGYSNKTSWAGGELRMGVSSAAPYPCWIQAYEPTSDWAGRDILLNHLGGRVGIGGEPGTRTIDEAKALAKTKLTAWKAEVKKRTAEQPEASTQEITLEVTDGDFGVMPTEQALAEFLQERAIGGGDAKLQVTGAGYFSDSVNVTGGALKARNNNVTLDSDTIAGYLAIGGTEYYSWNANDFRPQKDATYNLGDSAAKWKDGYFNGVVLSNGGHGRKGYGGVSFSNASDGKPWLVPTDDAGTAVDGLMHLGGPSYRFRNGYFSGTIYGTVDDVPSHVKAITPTQIANWDAGTGGGGGGANIDGRISDTQITNWDTAHGWGNHASAGYAKGSFVPTSGNTTISGTLTATDFVASSDERLKDNISPMPVGLIDDIKPVQWTWKESGQKSAGVIAQQLQEIGLDDFVTEGEDQMLAVNYNALVSVLLAEVISLKQKVEELSK